jgi:hypothetical protein
MKVAEAGGFQVMCHLDVQNSAVLRSSLPWHWHQRIHLFGLPVFPDQDSGSDPRDEGAGRRPDRRPVEIRPITPPALPHLATPPIGRSSPANRLSTMPDSVERGPAAKVAKSLPSYYRRVSCSLRKRAGERIARRARQMGLDEPQSSCGTSRVLD